MYTLQPLARRVFSTEAILDAAREVVVTRGARGATVEAISREAGVPVGSIYHRFDSLAELPHAPWLRAARRSQERALAVPRCPPSARSRAWWRSRSPMYYLCLEQPEDTLLLDALGRAELLSMELGALRGELEVVNERVEALMAGAGPRPLRTGRRPHARSRAAGAGGHAPRLRDRQLTSVTRTPARRNRLPAAVRAVLGGDGRRAERGSAGGAAVSASSS